MRDLTFTDGPMFQRLMGNREICRGVVERVLGAKVKHISNIVTEQAIEPRIGSHGVRLDAMMSADGRIYDVEMQTYQRGRIAKRLRYYQASIDVAALGKGCDYDRLPDTYVIFICTADFLGTGTPISTLNLACSEIPEFDCEHGFRWVILDASRWREATPDPLQDLLRFVDTGDAPRDDELIALIEAEMAAANASTAWKEEMMPFLTVEEDARIQARISYEDGRAEGQEALASLMRQLFADNRIDDARRAASDTNARAQLLEEYGL